MLLLQRSSSAENFPFFWDLNSGRVHGDPASYPTRRDRTRRERKGQEIG